MELIIGGVIYIVICQAICNVLNIKTFSKQALVYAVVGCVGSFIVKATLNPENEDESGGGYYYHTSQKMEGLISNYPVVMDLKINGDDVSGSYFYKSEGSGKRLYLNGSLDGNHLKLYERNADGMNTGYFDGTYSNGSYRGSFVNYKGTKYNFHLSTP